MNAGWRVAGTYFESCNCDAICPCRRTDGAEGGRSTHGVCDFALSWWIRDGQFGDLRDEAGFQWRFSGVCGFTTTFAYRSDS